MKKSLKKGIRAICILSLVVLVPVVVFSGQPASQSGEVTFRVFFSDTNADWNDMKDDLGVYLKEKTGVTIKPEFPVGDLSQKISLIIASGDYPDMIVPKGDDGALVEAGAMIDLEPLINQYAPNIKKVIGDQFDRMRFSLSDPKVYYIPTVDPVGLINFDTDAFFKLQLQALKEQGYPKVETVKDYEAVIEKYLKAHPKTKTVSRQSVCLCWLMTGGSSFPPLILLFLPPVIPMTVNGVLTRLLMKPNLIIFVLRSGNTSDGLMA